MRTRMSISLSCLLFLFVVAFLSYAMQPKTSHFLAVDAKLLEKTQSIASPTPSKIPTEKKEQKIVTQKKGIILSPTPIVATTNHASDASSNAIQNPTTNEAARGGSDTTQSSSTPATPTPTLITPTNPQDNTVIPPATPTPSSNVVTVSDTGFVKNTNIPGNVVNIFVTIPQEQPKVGNTVTVQIRPIPTTQP